jgi:hypothetical protein
MALTASATPLYAVMLLVSGYVIYPRNRVQDDIARILGMSPDRLFKFVHPFNRPNLFYEVRSCLPRLCPACSTVGNERVVGLFVDPVSFISRWNGADGRGVELHQRSASSTRKTINGNHILSKPCDM